MQDAAKNLVQALPDNDHLLQFADNLRQWLVADLNRSEEPVPDFTESRAKALMRAADLLDDPTRHSFARLVENETAVRVALFDLLEDSELAGEEAVAALSVTSAVSQTAGPAFDEWLSLIVAAYAWKSGYPLFQLDPASPPDPYSPAGQVLKRAAYFVRRQVQRSATERDKLGRQLAFAGFDRTPGLDNLQADGPVAPLPPYYRSPIPVKYPEVSSETLQVDPEGGDQPTGVTRGEPITITGSDLEAPGQPPDYREPIQISPAEPVTPPSTTRVVTPDAAVASGAAFSNSVRKRYGRGKQPMKTTKLLVIVQEYPDGPGLYGLQVRVSCKGIKSHVAGTTTREGKFTCELPVPESTGLTYDVDLSWPREMGGETERKSITLNADRTRFTLPFFHQHNKESADQAVEK